MFIKFSVDVILGSGLGVVAGSFVPSLGRKIKALWVKETQAFDKIVYSDYDKVKSAVKTDAEKVVSKL